MTQPHLGTMYKFILVTALFQRTALSALGTPMELQGPWSHSPRAALGGNESQVWSFHSQLPRLLLGQLRAELSLQRRTHACTRLHTHTSQSLAEATSSGPVPETHSGPSPGPASPVPSLADRSFQGLLGSPTWATVQVSLLYRGAVQEPACSVLSRIGAGGLLVCVCVVSAWQAWLWQS